VLQYNLTYPLTTPQRNGASTTFKIAIISDPDKGSRYEGKDTYYSELLYGELTMGEQGPTSPIRFEAESVKLKSGYSLSGRGMELSDLTVFNGHLYTVDDRTGIVFEITPQHKMVPWQILSDGNGANEKGFKGEWMMVKGTTLYAGGMGKEYTSPDGSIAHHNPEFVKLISPSGTFNVPYPS